MSAGSSKADRATLRQTRSTSKIWGVTVLVDTGPLVAYCRASEQAHEWARAQFASLQPPMLTCEPVITESTHLMANFGQSPEPIWQFLRRGVLKLSFNLATEFESIATLMRRYGDVPMDLADACLVRMSELHPSARILTVDSDFTFYRRFGRQVIPLITP